MRTHLPAIGWTAIVSPGDGALFGTAAVDTPRFGPEHPLSVQFTSGTTARPKAVLWTHANGLWGAMVNARHFQIRPDDVALINAPLFHTASLAWQVLGSIWVGASVVVQPRFSASRFWTVVVENGCTWATIGPFAAKALRGHPAPTGHSLRFNMCGVSLATSSHLFGIRSFGAYGMTETAGVCAIASAEDSLERRREWDGRVFPGMEIEAVDENRRLVPPGELGEVRLRSPQQLLGYTDPAINAAQIDEDGWFYPGDVGRVDEEGWVQLSGRTKDIVNRGGEKFSTADIETAIAAHSEVERTAVTAVHDERFGEGVGAWIVLRGGSSLHDAEPLLAHLEDRRLAKQKLPVEWHVVEEIPVSATGKVQKHLLHELQDLQTWRTRAPRAGGISGGGDT